MLHGETYPGVYGFVICKVLFPLTITNTVNFLSANEVKFFFHRNE